MNMKKIKRMLAGVLSAAMVMSGMAMTTFASPENPVTTESTIDDSLKGSLTIHKYTKGTVEGNDATGTTADEANIPAGAEKLKDVGFTLYKVADVNDLKAYYNTNPTKLPAATDYYTGSGKSVVVDTSKVKATVDEIKTDENGVASFSNLELGLYLVVETSSPALVTKPIAPFMVSIPMTTVDGDNWLYDVHVYPKNDTSVGTVELVKQDGNGKGLAGVTFALQKKNDNGGWTNITRQATAQGDNTGEDLVLVTDKNGNIEVTGLSNGTYRFVETSIGDNYGYIMDGAASYEFTVTDGTVKYTETGESTTTVNNYQPDMTKEVQDRTDKTWGQDSDYSVGDKIPYRITVEVPANITKLTYFTVKDEPTNLKDDTSDIKLTCDGADVATDAYSVAANGNGFVITFVPAKMEAYAGKDIVVTYYATLLSSAVTTTDGNPNTATLEYSNMIVPGEDDTDNPNNGKTPGNDVIKDNAIVYTFKLNVLKTGENGAKLAGVTFDLYSYNGTETKVTEDVLEKDGKKINVSEKTAGTAGEYVKDADGTATITTDANGNINVSGLANGTYYLVETKTNNGYNLLKEPVKVELKVAYTTSMTQSWSWEVDENGVKTLVKHEITTEETTFIDTDDKTGTDGYESQTIVNKKGFELPTTGGFGTLLFSLIGIGLAVAGGIVLVRGGKKKLS